MRRKDKQERRRLRRIILVCLLLLGSLLFLFATTGDKRFSLPDKLGLEVIGTLQRAASFVTGTTGKLWDDYIALWDVREQNQLLHKEVDHLKELNQSYREAAATNIRLQKLLQMKERLPIPSISADIIGKDSSLWTHTLIIDRGAQDGLQNGMPVVNADGIVGQIVDTSPHYAKVLLAIDPNSAIDVLIRRSRKQGILKGTGDGFELKYVQKNVEVKKGDVAVTSGFGDLFPKGLVAGVVSQVIKSKRGMFQKITITPAVDFQKLETVVVLLAESPLQN